MFKKFGETWRFRKNAMFGKFRGTEESRKNMTFLGERSLMKFGGIQKLGKNRTFEKFGIQRNPGKT